MKSITLLAGIAALSVLSAAAAHADSLPKEMIGGWCPSELGGGYYARNTDGRDFGQKRKSSRPAQHQFAWPLKADKSPHQARRVWQPEHTSEEIQEGGKKGQSAAGTV